MGDAARVLCTCPYRRGVTAHFPTAAATAAAAAAVWRRGASSLERRLIVRQRLRPLSGPLAGPYCTLVPFSAQRVHCFSMSKQSGNQSKARPVHTEHRYAMSKQSGKQSTWGPACSCCSSASSVRRRAAAMAPMPPPTPPAPAVSRRSPGPPPRDRSLETASNASGSASA